MKIQNWLSKHWMYMRRLQIELAEPVKSVDVNKCTAHAAIQREKNNNAQF